MPDSACSAALLGLSLLSAACSTEPAGCTADVRPGIVVAIRDSATGAALVAQAVGQPEDHRFADSLHAFGFTGDPPVLLSRASAFERAGTYVVTVFANGYHSWVRENVEVREGDCHGETVELEARLQAR